MRVVSENTANAKAGEGEAFMISHIFAAVPSGGKVYVRHVSGTEYLHSIVDINAVGTWKFTSYTGTTYTLNGTEIESINRKTDATKVLGATFYHTPTIDVLGTPRLQFQFGGGTTPGTARSSGFGEDIESIFGPGADVLIELENLTNAEQYCSFFFNVHEEKGV